MERGVRQGSLEGPLLFYMAFQAILEEAFSPLEHQAAKLTAQTENAHDLSIIAPPKR